MQKTHARHKANALTMTKGSLLKNIFLFSLPLMLSNVLQVLFNMSDVAVVGRFGPESALGAVGSTTTYVALFTGLLIGLGAGINAVVAQRIGANDEEYTSRAAHTAFLVAAAFGVVVAALAMGLARPVLILMKTKEEFLDGALLYIYIYFTGAIGTALYNFGNGVFSADGDTKKPLIYLSISGVTNIALNLFFVIVCDMSVAGVALASSISQWLSCVLILAALHRSKRPYKLRFSKLKMDWRIARLVLMLGIPAGIQNAIFQLANLFIQAGVNSFSPTVVEGNTAAVNADTLVFELMAAFYTGCTSFIGQNYGAGLPDRMLKSYFISLAYSFGAGLVFGLLIFAFADVFLSIFTGDAAIIAAGKDRLRVMCFSYALSAFMDCTIAASRGLNRTIVPTIMVILGSCVFRVFWVYVIFPIQGTTTLLYLLYPVSWIITAACEIAYFAYAFKKTRRKIAEALAKREAETQPATEGAEPSAVPQTSPEKCA